MQKYLLLTAMFVLAIFTTTQAQNLDHRSTISVAAGANLFQLVDRVLSTDETNTFTAKSTPSFVVSYDYAVKKWFSIGGSASFNGFTMKADDYTDFYDDGTPYTADIDLKYNRITAAVRPLFHYGNGGRIDMYSGFRVGLKIRNIDFSTTDPQLQAEEVSNFFRTGVGANFQFIPFGLRGYVTEHIGLGFELSMGAPHYAAFQLNYRM